MGFLFDKPEKVLIILLIYVQHLHNLFLHRPLSLFALICSDFERKSVFLQCAWLQAFLPVAREWNGVRIRWLFYKEVTIVESNHCLLPQYRHSWWGRNSKNQGLYLSWYLYQRRLLWFEKLCTTSGCSTPCLPAMHMPSISLMYI